MSEFTLKDVVPGARVTLRRTTLDDYGDDGAFKSSVEHTGTVDRITSSGPLHTIRFTSGRYFTFDPGTIEVLDVQPPEPVYEVGGIYWTTFGNNPPLLRKRFADGWSYAGLLNASNLIRSDEEVKRLDFTIGERVLISNYPDADAIAEVRADVADGNPCAASKLIADALDAEARS